MSVDATITRRALQTAMIVVSATGWAATANAGDAGDSARVRRAISYLDERQVEWSRFTGAQRGKGAESTSCVSCHTGVSYALARPAVRSFAAAPGPAAPEQRMVDAVGLRVAHWAELDSAQFALMYDHDDRKKVESRGTEAVLNALLLTRDDAIRGQKSPSSATRDALQHLWKTQAMEGSDAGSWDWLNFGLEPWEADDSRAFGAALAAIAVGTAPGYLEKGLDDVASRGVRSLHDYLRRRFSEETLYNRLWILEASTKLPDLLSADQKREVVEQLLAIRREDGGWALATLGNYERVDGTPQPRESDGYATGLALHTLLNAGLPSLRPEIAQGLGWLRSHQQENGAWLGRSLNKERNPATFIGKLMSDAATALAVLAITEAQSR